MEKIKIGRIVNAVALRGEVKIYNYSGYRERYEELDRIIIENEEYDLIALFGNPALFTNERLTDADIPKGLYCYHLREGSDGRFATIETKVAVNHGGTVITDEPIDCVSRGYIAFTEDTEPNFMGEKLTFGKYIRGEFEQDENASQQTGGMHL